MKLLNKLAVVIALFMVPTIIIILVVGISLVRYAATQASAQQQKALAARILQEVDRQLFNNQLQLGAIGHDNSLHSAVINKSPDTLDSQRVELQNLADTTGLWTDLRVMDTNGRVLTALDRGAVGKSVGSESKEWRSAFEQALKGTVNHSNVFVEGASEDPLVVFAAPIQLAGGQKPAGVVMGKLSWSVVQDILSADSERHVTLMNNKGVIISDSKSGVTGALEGAPRSETVIRSILKGKDEAESIENSETGEVFVSAVRQQGVPGYKGDGWILKVEAPNRLAVASVSKILPAIGTTLILFALFGAAVLLLIINHTFIEPVKQLTGATQKIAVGNFQQRLPVRTKDEFGILTESFNKMSSKLQDFYASLESKVAEKTAQLAQKVNEIGVERAKDEALLNNIGEGMIAVDVTGHILKINQQAAKIAGLQKLPEPGSLLNDFLKLYNESGMLAPAESLPFAVAIASGKTSSQLRTVVRPDGSKIAVMIVASPVVQDDRQIGVIMVIRDVTKEREVDRMKTEFISLASHQLRTPLSAIRWFGEMLLSGDAGELTPEQHDFVTNMSASADRMTQLVNGLLNISRIESGRIIVEPKPTDLQELVDGVVGDLKAKIEEKHQTLVVSVHKDLPKVNLDPHLIGQVYLNFLTNAIKYTPKGGEISVFVSRKGEELVSQITDNGYGIPKEQQARVFQKFFRAENAVKIETDGTGLGLYLVKAIIESSGGRVWFESQEGKGTTFWFSLPMSGMQAHAGEVKLDV